MENEIINIACEVCRVSREELLGDSRRQRFVDSRAVVAVLLHDCKYSQQAIAHALGYRDRSSVSHLLKRENEEFDHQLWIKIQMARKQLKEFIECLKNQK